MTQEIVINLPMDSPKTYPIKIGVNLHQVNEWLPKKIFSRMVIITDNVVNKKMGLGLQNALQQAGHESLLIAFRAGEKFKDNKTKQSIENFMLAHRCDRETLILALGGGVVGDMAGFVAATYLRGIDYIQLPTTLLAMVDSSVGGKTAINALHGKNLIGAIYHPLCVVADFSMLKTLPKKHRINGLIEAIKMFLTHDAESVDYVALHGDEIIKGNIQYLHEVVIRAVKIKSAMVSRDEKEKGERAVLNFGHTIGHALEKISGYTLLHGHAVAYGILMEAHISNLLGLLAEEDLLKIKNLLSRLGFNGEDLKGRDVNAMIQATYQDKKAKLNHVHYVLLKKIGEAHVENNQYAHTVSEEMVRLAFENTKRG